MIKEEAAYLGSQPAIPKVGLFDFLHVPGITNLSLAASMNTNVKIFSNDKD